MSRLLRITSSVIFVLVLFCTSINAQEIEWKQVESLSTGYSSGEAVAVDGKIFFLTGRTQNASSSKFLMYDPELDQWSNLPDIPEIRMNLAFSAIGNEIYAIGGDPILASGHKYSVENQEWSQINDMPTGRRHIDCGEYAGKIYVIGGIVSNTQASMKNEAYNIENDTWEEKEPTPSIRNNPAIASVDSLIYVIGGGGSESSIWEEVSTVESYNVITNTWEVKTDSPHVLFKPGAVVHDKEIYVLGGFSGDVTDKVLVYNTITDTWRETTPLP